MENSKMAEVAALFGKKLGEPFRCKVTEGEKSFEARFTSSGIVVTNDDWPSALLLQLLLLDEAVIIDADEE